LNSFFPPRKKLLELLLLIAGALVLYFFYSDWDAVGLFVFGFIWNWSASNDLRSIQENKRYRFSLIKLVSTIQVLALRPFEKAPEAVKCLIRVFPAGLFWLLVIMINESTMPWWSTFLGSLLYEVWNLEQILFKRHKEVS
jgi:hypothetical protein